MQMMHPVRAFRRTQHVQLILLIFFLCYLFVGQLFLEMLPVNINNIDICISTNVMVVIIISTDSNVNIDINNNGNIHVNNDILAVI